MVVFHVFNEDRKKKFINYIESQSKQSVAKKVFNQTIPYEEKYMKDLCEFSVDELSEVLSNMTFVTVSNQTTKRALLSAYFKWCADMDYSGNEELINGVRKINLDNYDIIRKRTVKSPADLQARLNSIFLPESENTMDNVYRLYFWLAYSGVHPNFMREFTQSNINFRTMVMSYADLKFPVYRESIECLNKCIDLTSFRYIINPKENVVSTQKRSSGKELLRGLACNDNDKDVSIAKAVASSVSSKISRGHKDVYLSYSAILDSGFYYRIYCDELNGEKLVFSNYAKEILYSKHGCKYSIDKNTVSTRASRMKKSYLAWKIAHNL